MQELKGIDLDIHPGEVLAILGLDGGKTTFVEIEGYRVRIGGELAVLGMDPAHGDAGWKARLGIVLQSAGFFEMLSVEELITHFASFYPDPLPVDQAIELAGLEEKRRWKVAKLSGGQRRRVDVALGIIGNPELIFSMSRPPASTWPPPQAWYVVRGSTSLGKTVVLTTHYLDEAEQLADRVAVIIGGQLVALGHPSEIGGRDHAVATVTFRRQGLLATAELPQLDGEVGFHRDEVQVRTATPAAVTAALVEWSRAAGVPELPALTVTRPSLEDIYLEMIAAHQPEAAEATEVAA
ncbi:MAG: ABC transporter ATP-binding protein [Dehalococcoidia bacterium]|nr:ABC transporter ATP-binding protein [Dehalococcoidia bacterium]